MKLNSAMRWLALVAVLLNIAFNYAYVFLLPNNAQIAEISAKYESLFTPASYAFSIWSVIYLSLIIFSVYQLSPSQRSHEGYDKLSGPLILINLLSIGWITSFSYDKIGLSTLIIIGMLITAFVLFHRASYSLLKNKWFVIPFSLYAGWLTVASIASISIFLLSLGWNGGALGPALWTILMISLTCIVGFIVSVYYKDVIYPLVIAWACLAIAINTDGEGDVKTVALVTMAIIVCWVIAFQIKLYIRSKH